MCVVDDSRISTNETTGELVEAEMVPPKATVGEAEVITGRVAAVPFALSKYGGVRISVLK